MRRPMRSKRGREEEEEKETGRRNPKVPKGIDGNLLRENRNSLLTLGAVTLLDTRIPERGQSRQDRQEVLKVLGKPSTKRASTPASPFPDRIGFEGFRSGTEIESEERTHLPGLSLRPRLPERRAVSKKPPSNQWALLALWQQRPLSG